MTFLKHVQNCTNHKNGVEAEICVLCISVMYYISNTHSLMFFKGQVWNISDWVMRHTFQTFVCK